MRHLRHGSQLAARGFTLVELLVVIGIIAVLMSLLLVAVGSARRQARTVRELASLQQMMSAYHMYANENRGRVLPGFWNGGPQTNGHGLTLVHPTSSRYPWRLAPYLNYDVVGTLIVNEQELRIGREHPAPPGFEYVVSLYPSFGINATFVGGNFAGGAILPVTPTTLQIYGRFSVVKLTDVRVPTDLIVFASSRSNDSGNPQEGNHLVEPPYLLDRRWSAAYSDSDPAESWGYVHPRHNQRAAVALLDGHAELFDKARLQDMRHWSHKATRPDWVVAAQ